MRRPLSIFLVLFLFFGFSCASRTHPSNTQPSDHYHWRPTNSSHAWVVFIPGSSGLKIFDDERHYFDVANRLNDQGWSVLLVDYKAAYRATNDPPEGNTPSKIAWVTEQAIQWLHHTQPVSQSQSGAIVAWSLGAEGALEIANNDSQAKRLGIQTMALYYPSNQEKRQLKTNVPLLILSGEADNITPAKEIRSTLNNRENVHAHFYPNAHHGFDIASLREGKSVRRFPLFGKKVRLEYNQAAAVDAEAKLLAFLKEQLAPPASTAPEKQQSE